MASNSKPFCYQDLIFDTSEERPEIITQILSIPFSQLLGTSCQYFVGTKCSNIGVYTLENHTPWVGDIGRCHLGGKMKGKENWGKM